MKGSHFSHAHSIRDYSIRDFSIREYCLGSVAIIIITITYVGNDNNTEPPHLRLGSVILLTQAFKVLFRHHSVLFSHRELSTHIPEKVAQLRVL